MREPFSSKEEWLATCASTVELLKTLSPNEFYDQNTMRYHPSARNIARLVYGLADAADFGAFLRSEDQSTRRLPSKPEALKGMATSEIHFRLMCNLADRRWLPGFLADAFNDGVLIPALESLATNIERFELGV